MTILAHFDGKAIVPDDPVEIPAGQALRVTVDFVEEVESPHAWMLEMAADLPDSPGDLAHQHDHYLYGTSKVQ